MRQADPGGLATAGEVDVAASVQASPDALLVVDAGGVVRYANAAARELLERPPRPLVGAELGLPVAQHEQLVAVRNRDGELRSAELRATPVTTEGQDGWVVSIRDVTVREAAHAQDLLRADESTAALAITSHELRNPMGALTGFADLLLLDWARLSDEQRLAGVRRLARVSRRLQLIVNRFLDAARVDAGLLAPVPERTDVLEVLLEGLPDLGYAAADVDVQVPEGCVVQVGRDHLWSVLSNLVLNALRHAGPPVVVGADPPAGGHVVLRVADRGPGVPAELADRLFERYARGDRPDAPSGTGLGLWITRSLVEAYGGACWHEPAVPGGDRPGAVFACRLPSG